MAKRLIPTLVTSSLVASALVLASTTPALADDAPTPVLGVTSSTTSFDSITAQALAPDGGIFTAGSYQGQSQLAYQSGGNTRTWSLGNFNALSFAFTTEGGVPYLYIGGSAPSGGGVVKTYVLSTLETAPQSAAVAAAPYAKYSTDLGSYIPTSLAAGPDAAGLFSFYFEDATHGVVVSYKRSSTAIVYFGKTINALGYTKYGDIKLSADGKTLYAAAGDTTGTLGKLASFDTATVPGVNIPKDTTTQPVPVLASKQSADLAFSPTQLIPSADASAFYVLGAANSGGSWVAEAADATTLQPTVAPTAAAAGTLGRGVLSAGKIYDSLTSPTGTSTLVTLDPATFAATDAAVDLGKSPVGVLTSDNTSYYVGNGDGRLLKIGLGRPLSGPATVSLTGTPVVGGAIGIDAAPASWTPPAVQSCAWYVNKALVASGTCTYSPTASQLAGALYAVVTATAPAAADGTPYFEATRTTNTVTIGKGTMTASAAPKITGTAKFGSTLKITMPEFGPAITGFAPSYSYQWYADGKKLTAVASRKSSYKPANVKVLLGKKLSVTVTAHAAGFNDLTVTSAQTKPIAAGPLTAKTPTLIGSAKVGTTLVANHGSWGPGKVHFIYRWYANGKQLPGKTTSKLKVSKIWIGKQIRVKVYGTETGFVKTSKTSAYKKPHK